MHTSRRILADKGYVNRELAQRLLREHGVCLIARTRKNQMRHPLPPPCKLAFPNGVKFAKPCTANWSLSFTSNATMPVPLLGFVRASLPNSPLIPSVSILTACSVMLISCPLSILLFQTSTMAKLIENKYRAKLASV